MTVAAYYNEIDPVAAQWLRNLIAAGHIAPGDVDDRSIEDVLPSDLSGYTQCHFFAGVGIWALALRRAGWPDDRPVWTGSCPCQPFSAAGAGAGFADERHLWPAFHHLIKERAPTDVFGEQVASKDADPWIDLVHTDMEALGYAFGAVPFPSASVGAPHIRDRLYWVGVGQADTNDKGLEGRIGMRKRAVELSARKGLMAGRMANADGRNAGTEWEQCSGKQRQQSKDGGLVQARPAGPTNGHWRTADWLGCRDGKWRPVEPGTFPLAHGAPARVGRLRAYGNAINAIQAQIFIEEVMGAQCEIVRAA